jgi:signal transduction histidine kinase
VGIVEAVLDLIFWWLPPGLSLRLHAALNRALLCVSVKSRLAQRVEQLAESRAETVDTQAAELRRIERDLHDGAQARLVALGMSLAMAEQQLERDPDGARALLTEARTASSDALAELRDLVRGIHPPVLADRGLDGAVRALALAAPLAVEVEVTVPQRLPAPVESAAYFAVAEALTNVAKHAHAQHAWVRVSAAGDELTLTVRDDGRGGADPGRGTGLRGIGRRLGAFDGTLAVESPEGGPTTLVMVLPCASSSPKTSPFYGTA